MPYPVQPIALPDDLARQIAARDQAQQEAAALVNAMTCSVYERLVVHACQQLESGASEETAANQFHLCARRAKLAARVFTQAFFRQAPASPT